MANTLQALRISIEGLAGRQVGQALNKYHPSVVRTYLEVSGVIAADGRVAELLKLRELADGSLALVGDEESSSLIAALDPAEITQVVSISPEVFDIESGPWAENPGAVAFTPLAVEAYFTAICNTSDRDIEWKEEALEAILPHLIAANQRTIYERCLREFPSIAQKLREAEGRAVEAVEDVAGNYLEALDRAEQELLKRNVMIPRRDLDEVFRDLRDAGVADPSTDEVLMGVEQQRTMRQLTRDGK